MQIKINVDYYLRDFYWPISYSQNFLRSNILEINAIHY